jgi:hypothetical protein
MSACVTFGGTVPIGGGALAGCERSQVAKAVAETTCALVRISEWPAPHSSVHSTG